MAQAGYVTNAVRPLITGAGVEPSTNLVRTAHGEFVGVLAAHPPRPIPVRVNAADLEDRANYLNKVLSALAVYVAAVLEDTSQNVPGGLNRRYIDALLSDLVSDVTGTVLRAADDLAGRVA